MANKNKIIRQRFSLYVDKTGETVSGAFEVDTNIKEVIGVLISSDREDIVYYRGSQIMKHYSLRVLKVNI